MNELVRRLWAGAEAEALGRGGIAAVARATGLAISTVTLGRNEVRAGVTPRADLARSRRIGGGRRRHEVVHPELIAALRVLVDPGTRGDPESALRWTSKSTHKLSAEMFTQYGIRVGDKTIARLLRELGYSLQAASKTVEGSQHPDRDAQFEHINAKATDCLARGIPFISVDTKKKELVGNCKNAGREWQADGAPELVDVHDFPSDAIGKAIPYGVYDVGANNAFVTVGTDHDTPCSPPRRSRPGGSAWAWSATPTRGACSSPPTRVEAIATGRTSGRSSFSGWPTSCGFRFTSATFRPAPASGTRSSTGCSRSSRSTGAASRSEPTRRS